VELPNSLIIFDKLMCAARTVRVGIDDQDLPCTAMQCALRGKSQAVERAEAVTGSVLGVMLSA
jgi:hypothetical protein